MHFTALIFIIYKFLNVKIIDTYIICRIILCFVRISIFQMRLYLFKKSKTLDVKESNKDILLNHLIKDFEVKTRGYYLTLSPRKDLA